MSFTRKISLDLPASFRVRSAALASREILTWENRSKTFFAAVFSTETLPALVLMVRNQISEVKSITVSAFCLAIGQPPYPIPNYPKHKRGRRYSASADLISVSGPSPVLLKRFGDIAVEISSPLPGLLGICCRNRFHFLKHVRISRLQFTTRDLRSTFKRSTIHAASDIFSRFAIV